MLKFVVLAAFAVLVRSQVDLCRTDLGNGGNWLGLEIQGAEVLETAIQNFPQSERFCYGETEAGTTEASFYTELTCETSPGPGRQVQNLPQCGASDLDVPFCVDNQLRAAIRLAAETTESAEELARLVKVVSAPREYVIFVAKITGAGQIATNVYTDTNVCLVLASDASGTAQFIVATAKQGEFDDQGPTNAKSPKSKHAFREAMRALSKSQKKATQEEPEEPPIGEKCLFDIDTNPGFWNTLVHIGAIRAAIVGDSIIGENSCLDDRRDEDRFDFGLYQRNDVECDDVPELKTKNSNQVTLQRYDAFAVDDLQQDPFQLPCRIDTDSSQCINNDLREYIRRQMLTSTESDSYVLAKQLQQHLGEDGWQITVVTQGFGLILRSIRSDLHHCSILGQNANGDLIVVTMTKLEF